MPEKHTVFPNTLMSCLFFCLLWAAGTARVVNAAQPMEAVALESPNWDRSLAISAAAVVDVQQETNSLLTLVENQETASLLVELNSLAGARGESKPAAEAVLFEFVQQLRSLPPSAVDQSVTDFLVSYQPSVLVPHEESLTMGVPLFPVRAAAAGLLNQWAREEAQQEARALLAVRPSEALRVYASTDDSTIRAGFKDAIDTAAPENLDYLVQLGVPMLGEYPGLTGLLGAAAIRTRDVDSISRVLVSGSGHELVGLIRSVGQGFASDEAARVLLATLDSAPQSTASVALAELAPYTLHDTGVSEALLNRLDDPVLGSSVALALVSWGNEDQRNALRARAEAAPSSLAAKRIQTALSLTESRHTAARQK